jgi:GLPGLI family protein
MNKFIIGLFLILILAGKTSAQEIQFTSEVTVMYDMYVVFTPFPYYSAMLDFNNSEALFSYQQMGDSPNSTSKSKVIKGGDDGNFVAKISTKINRIYENKESGVLLEYDNEDKGELIIDSIQPIKWRYIENKTKKIADYDCFMAQGHFRGCHYTVWYTPEIPSSFGPWKLNGCPGLILEATRDEKDLSFYVSKISFGEKGVVSQISNKKEHLAYAKSRQSTIDQMNKTHEKLSSQRQRGDEDRVMGSYIGCLECDWLDELKHFSNISVKRQKSLNDEE